MVRSSAAKRTISMPTLPDSAKAQIHSAKLLPSAALGKDNSAKKQPPKGFLPIVFYRALGKARALGKEKHSANKKILEK